MTIAIDFDGTLCLHEYPFLGDPVPHALDVVKKLLRNKDHVLILLTMREGIQLDDATSWLHAHGIDFHFVNCNPTFETGSRKVYANIYVDDHNIGVPLVHDIEVHRKPFVDWKAVEVMLKKQGAL